MDLALVIPERDYLKSPLHLSDFLNSKMQWESGKYNRKTGILLFGLRIMDISYAIMDMCIKSNRNRFVQ